jgi:mannose-6-phosphate isomerase-like protein (cupin superfamily)
MQYLVTRDDLERRHFGKGGVAVQFFHGGEHGLGTISLMLGDVQPGDGAPLHRHTYEELFVVHEGRGAYTIGETTVEAGSGDIVLIPAGVPHKLRNIGETPLRHTAVHQTDRVVIEWLDGDRPAHRP